MSWIFFIRSRRPGFAPCSISPPPLSGLGWPAIAGGENTLILAPTGTGKTLTAFLWCLDRLMLHRAATEDRGVPGHLSQPPQGAGGGRGTQPEVTFGGHREYGPAGQESLFTSRRSVSAPVTHHSRNEAGFGGIRLRFGHYPGVAVCCLLRMPRPACAESTSGDRR